MDGREIKELTDEEIQNVINQGIATHPADRVRAAKSEQRRRTPDFL